MLQVCLVIPAGHVVPAETNHDEVRFQLLAEFPPELPTLKQGLTWNARINTLHGTLGQGFLEELF